MQSAKYTVFVLTKAKLFLDIYI